MDRSFEKEYRLALFFLKICGLLPLESKSKLVNWLIPFCMVTSVLFLQLPAVYGLANFPEQVDVSRRFNVVGLTEETTFILLKTLVLIWVREKMSKLIKICKNLWESVENENDIAIVEPYLKQGRYFIYCYTIQSFASIIIIMFYSIFNEVNLEIDGTVPTVSYVACLCVAVDAVIPALVIYASGHMRLVEFWLNDMNNRRENTTDPDEYDSRRELVKCIQHHQKVYFYYETLESALSLVMLLQICLSMSVTAIVGANILMERGGIFSRIPLLVGAILRLLVQCWPPDQVYSAGVAVARAIYALPWTSWSVQDRKLLLTMLMRAQKPLLLTAGKFTAMSLATFSEIMSRAMSFYALLRAST